jgi:hypothetical protein
MYDEVVMLNQVGARFLAQERAGCQTGDEKVVGPPTPQQQPATYHLGDTLTIEQLEWWAAFRSRCRKMPEAA